MSALKSARDQINRPGEVNRMLAMFGSDSDKLRRLVNTAAAPLFMEALASGAEPLAGASATTKRRGSPTIWA
jgi:hypothetical protein